MFWRLWRQDCHKDRLSVKLVSITFVHREWVDYFSTESGYDNRNIWGFVEAVIESSWLTSIHWLNLCIQNRWFVEAMIESSWLTSIHWLNLCIQNRWFVEAVIESSWLTPIHWLNLCLQNRCFVEAMIESSWLTSIHWLNLCIQNRCFVEAVIESWWLTSIHWLNLCRQNRCFVNLLTYLCMLYMQVTWRCLGAWLTMAAAKAAAPLRPRPVKTALHQAVLDGRLHQVSLPTYSSIMTSRHIDGLVQETRDSSALGMELRLSCTDPSVCFPHSSWYSFDDKCFGIIVAALWFLLISKWTTLQWMKLQTKSFPLNS